MMDKFRKRKVVATIICGLVLTSIPAVSLAETANLSFSNNEVAPCFEYIESYQNKLSISGTTASVNCYLYGNYALATKVKIDCELQEKNGSSWYYVNSWTAESQSDYVSLNKIHSVTDGKTYRLKTTFTVWNGSTEESTTYYSSEKTA